jgi:catechol 2,3-dioxygenase-like lactoylglutathione lyase family enzyme
MAKPKIRHLALFARDPEKLAAFYMDVFGMELIHSDGPGKGQYLSDGYFTLAILKHKLEASAAHGLNHFGFSIDDRAAYAEKLVAYGVEEPKPRPSDRPFAEYRAVDPEGNWFDLSEHGFADPETADQRAGKAGGTTAPASRSGRPA